MAISGLGGAVRVGVNKVAEIRNWSIDLEADTLDNSTFDGNGWKAFIAGQRGWSGSFEGNWKMSDTNGQRALQNAALAGTTIAVEFDVNGTNNYSGNIFITNMSISTPSDEVVTVTFDFQGVDALVYE